MTHLRQINIYQKNPHSIKIAKKKPKTAVNLLSKKKTPHLSKLLVNAPGSCVFANGLANIKNPIITINKNSFRTNNHFNHHHHTIGIGNGQHNHHHPPFLPPIAESSAMMYNVAVGGGSKDDNAMLLHQARKRAAASLCKSCMNGKLLTMRRFCECCGKELLRPPPEEIKRRVLELNDDNKDDVRSRKFQYLNRCLENDKKLLARVYSRRNKPERHEKRRSESHSKLSTGFYILNASRKNKQNLDNKKVPKTSCMKKSKAMVNIKQIEPHKGND
jgi:hypothetical protein